MTTAQQIETQAAKITDAIPAVKRIEAVDARLAAIREEEREFRKLLPKEEVAARCREWLGSVRDRYRRESGRYEIHATAFDLVRALSGSRRPHLRSEDDVFALLVFLLGPALEESASRAILSLDFEEGPSSDVRTRRSAEMVTERQELIAEREELVERVNAAGLGLAHLPETVEKRSREAAQAEREEEARRREAEAAREIDARHERERRQVEHERRTRPVDPDARPSSVVSSYLAAGGSRP